MSNSFKIKNIALYAFFKPSFELDSVRSQMQERMRQLEIKGTILLASEGINCSLAGNVEEMDEFLKFLLDTIKPINPPIKTSYSEEFPFRRSLVKVKPYIVAKPGNTPIDPSFEQAPYISPEEFHQWIQANKEMVILDTRNDYEYQVGYFKNACHLGTKHFSDFEGDLQQAPQEWHAMPVVTFCTGGIRCEKAAPLMLKKGFQEVYQLEGGILNYFKKVGRGYFEGECFVFDERVALDEKLNEKLSIERNEQ